MRPDYTFSISTGIRNICLGRVLLKEDVAAGEKEIPVGDIPTAPDDKLSLTGTGLFYKNHLDLSGDAVLVQPAASDEPGEVEHQEDIVIDQSLLTQLALNIFATDALAEDYTVARGAYLRLSTLPPVCGTLKMIQRDFLDPMLEAADNWFPGVMVVPLNVTRSNMTNVHYEDNHTIMVRYAELMGPDYDGDQTEDALSQLESLLRESQDLGGTTHWMEIPRPAVMTTTPGRLDNRAVRTKQDRGITWGDIYILAHRYQVIDKSPLL